MRASIQDMQEVMINEHFIVSPGRGTQQTSWPYNWIAKMGICGMMETGTLVMRNVIESEGICNIRH
jgi:hypothetical protein